MKSILASCLALTLALAGCGQREEIAPTPPPPPPPPKAVRETKTVPPPSTGQEPVAHAQPAGTPPAPLPADLVQKYQTLWNDTDARAKLIDEVATHALDGGNPADIAKVYAGMFRAEPTAELKVSILDELGMVESPAALEPLLAALESNQPEEVRQSAQDAAEALINTLAFNQDKGLFDKLVPVLDRRYPTTLREAAITALEDLEDQRALPHLQRLTNDPDESVRDAAQNAIEWLKDK